MHLNHSLLLIFFCCNILSPHCATAKYARFSSIKVKDYSKGLCKHINYSLNKNYQLNTELILSRNVQKFQVNVFLNVIRANNLLSNYIKFSFDGCQLMQVATHHRIIFNIHREMYKNSNYPRKCPVLAVSFF